MTRRYLQAWFGRVASGATRLHAGERRRAERGRGDGQELFMTTISRILPGVSLPVRWAVVGTASAGVIGGAVGLVVGI